jgi:glycosyl hydrolase family 26
MSRRAAVGLAAVATVSAVSAAVAGIRQWHSAVAPGGTDDSGAGGGAGAGSPAASVRASPTPNVRATSAPTATASPVPIGGGPVTARRGITMLGAYLDLKGLTFAESQALRRKQLGRDERIVHVFYDWTDTLPVTVAGMPAAAIPMISWRGTKHADILGGRYDGVIRTAARRLARDGRPKLLRWGWEMNGDWYIWGGPKNGGNAAGYVACWKYLRKIFAAEGAHNVSWVWSVNWNNQPDTAANRFQAYYPGDQYVDWVAISGYDLNLETPERLYDGLYQEYASRKPMMISECGAVDRGGTTKADWITAFAAYVTTRPNIAAVVWFDTDTHPTYEEKWRIDTDARSIAAYRAMARSPRFAG